MFSIGFMGAIRFRGANCTSTKSRAGRASLGRSSHGRSVELRVCLFFVLFFSNPQDRAPEGSAACAARCFCAAGDEGDNHTCRTGRTTSLAICSGKSHPGSPIGARLVRGAHRGAADGEHARTRAAHRRQNHTLHGERLAARTATMKRARATPVVGAASVRWLSDAVSKRRTGRQKRRRRRDRKRRRGAATMSRAESGSCVVSRKRISITAARWQGGWTAALADGTMAMVGECECVRGRARARPRTCRREAARLGIGPPRHRPAQSPLCRGGGARGDAAVVAARLLVRRRPRRRAMRARCSRGVEARTPRRARAVGHRHPDVGRRRADAPARRLRGADDAVARGARAVDDGRLDARGAHGVRLARLGAVGTRERGLHRLALRDLARQLGRARDERRDAAAASADDTMAMVGECECECVRGRARAWASACVGKRVRGRARAWASACVGERGRARVRA